MHPELAERVVRALAPDADHVTLREQASAVVRRHLGFDLAVWSTVDPATVMTTSCVLDGAERDLELEVAIFDNEYGTEDVLKLVDLAEGDLVGTLVADTDGEPASSARYRDVLQPRGVTDELRVVFSDGTTPWGALHLLRSGGPFGSDEVEAMRHLVTPFAGALRAALVRSRAGEHLGAPVDPAAFPLGSEGAGLVLCDSEGRVREVTDAAWQLLGGAELPPVVGSLVARHRHAGSPTTTAVAAREDGHWLTFQTTALGSQVAVVVERIRPGRLADLIVRSRGLSPRETQVFEQLVLGKANKQIARVLAISDWTVQDHVKAVLAKFGVSSRAELVSAVFYDHYAPLHAGRLPSGTSWPRAGQPG